MTASMTREGILRLLSQYPAITQKEIAQRLGITERTVTRHVQAIRASWRSEDME